MLHRPPPPHRLPKLPPQERETGIILWTSRSHSRRRSHRFPGPRGCAARPLPRFSVLGLGICSPEQSAGPAGHGLQVPAGGAAPRGLGWGRGRRPFKPAGPL